MAAWSARSEEGTPQDKNKAQDPMVQGGKVEGEAVADIMLQE
mgnify:CR=1 FL=1